MKLLIHFMLILCCLTNTILYSKDKLEKKLKWSANQGEMTWDNANAKCISIGMKLPTIAELTAALNTKVTESWKKDGNHYWTSEEYFKNGKDYAYLFLLDLGGWSGVDYPKYAGGLVRCVQ